MSQARHLTKAERCSLFLLDKQHKCLVAKVFDGTSSGSGQWGTTDGRQLGIPADQGIAGHVAITGQLLNISDAYAHPLFYQDVDKTTGFKTRWVFIALRHLRLFFFICRTWAFFLLIWIFSPILGRKKYFVFPDKRWRRCPRRSRIVQQNQCSLLYAGRWGIGHVFLHLLRHFPRAWSHVQKSARRTASEPPEQRAYDVSHEGIVWWLEAIWGNLMRITFLLCFSDRSRTKKRSNCFKKNRWTCKKLTSTFVSFDSCHGQWKSLKLRQPL